MVSFLSANTICTHDHEHLTLGGDQVGGGTHWVVQGTVHFSGDDSRHKVNGVVDNPMYLWDTSHSVGILDTPTVEMIGYRESHITCMPHPFPAMPLTSNLGGVDIGVEESPESGGDHLLTWVWPVGMDVVIKGFWSPLQGLDGQCCDDISLLGNEVTAIHCLGTNSTDELCPIDQR